MGLVFPVTLLVPTILSSASPALITTHTQKHSPCKEREYRAEDEQEEEGARDRLLLVVEFICSLAALFPGWNSEKSHIWWSGGRVG